ncbi:unnamed protein product [Symbiodinium sp. KB8]|nr:unnamed protein product [Symbiodinium sp. KB8]
MTKKGYEKMVRSMPGLLQGAFDMSVAGQCFANNLAFSAGQSWELKFEHFLSAVLDIATVRYPVQDGNLSESVKFLLDGHFIPLYADIFGEDFLQVDGTPVPLSLADRSKLPVIAEAARKLRTNLVSTAEGVMSPLRAAEAGLAVLDAKGITRHRSSRRASTFGTGGPRSGAARTAHQRSGSGARVLSGPA